MTKGTETHELSVEGEKVLERTESGTIVAEKDYDHVIRGYKAAAHNPRFTEETHKNAEHIRHDLEAAHDAQASEHADTAASGSPKHTKSATAHHGKTVHAAEKPQHETHEEEVHRHRIVGGLKANLHRDDRSEETKDHIREKLHEMGEDTE
ncbi:hypothetical protein JCM10450v2_007500 [Rhodotorula kratochvilovae]